MLIGNGNIEALAQGAPVIESFGTDELQLEQVETLQVLCEIQGAGTDSLLPPALHPTLPPAVTWLVQRVPESPWGPFGLAQCRIECRSGLRPRGFLRTGVIDNPQAAEALSTRWGYRLRAGHVALDRGYDRVRATVAVEERTILDLAARAPQPLDPHDVYYVANMNLADSPHGLRLVQVDSAFEVERAERGSPIIDCFDAGAWDSEGVRPSYPVSASFTVGRVTLPRLRYICRPDILAFEGTERVDT